MVFYELGLQEGLREKEVPTVSVLAGKVFWDDRIENLKTGISLYLADMLVSAVQQQDIGEMIIEKGTEAVQEKKSSMGLAGLFIKESSVRQIIEKIYAGLVDHLNRDGRKILVPLLKTRIDTIAETPVNEIISEENSRKLRVAFDKIYNEAIADLILKFKEDFDIAKVVEEKVRAMNIAELEELCLSVVKKELNSIVWLGAVLGFLIGIFNAFF